MSEGRNHKLADSGVASAPSDSTKNVVLEPPHEESSLRSLQSAETETGSTGHSSSSSKSSPSSRAKGVLHTRATPVRGAPTFLPEPFRVPNTEVIPFPTFTMPVEPPEAFKEAAQLCIRQQQHKQVGSASAVARQHNLQGLEECLTVKKAEALIKSSHISHTLLTHFAAETFVVAMSYERCAAHVFYRRRMSSSTAETTSSQQLSNSETVSNLDLRELVNPVERMSGQPPVVDQSLSGGSDSAGPGNVSFGERPHGGASEGSSSVVVGEPPKETLKPLSILSATSQSPEDSPIRQGPGRNPVTLGADIPDILLRFTDKYHFDHIPTEDIRKALRARSHEEQTSMLVDLLSAVRGAVLQRHQILSANTSSGQMSLGSPAVGLHAVPSMKTLPVPQLVHDLEVGEDDAGFPTVNAYTIIGEAGKGSYGSVKIALNATGDQRAIKVMPKGKLRKKWADVMRRRHTMGSSQADQSVSGVPLPGSPDTDKLSKLHHEIAVMKKIRHQNIVPLLEVIDDPNEDVLYLVMPYIERGPLLRMTPQGTCAPLDIDVAKGYMRQLLDAMQYLHERHIVHRDIKPDNILLGNDGRVYLSDFGVSQMFKEDEEESVDAFGGTPAFMAPECFVASGHAAILGKPVDVWALGVTFYSMVLGHLPFEGHSVLEMGTAIKTEELQLPPLESFPADRQPDYQLAFDLLHEMLEKDPKLRFSVRQCRFHPFVCRMKSRVDILRHHPPRAEPQAKERASLSPQRRGGSPMPTQPPPTRKTTMAPIPGRHQLPHSSIAPLSASVVLPPHDVHVDDSPFMAASASLMCLVPTPSVPREGGDDEFLTSTSSVAIAVEVTDEERENALTYCFHNDTTDRRVPQFAQLARQMLKSTTAGSPLLRGVPQERLDPLQAIKRPGGQHTPRGKPSFDDATH